MRIQIENKVTLILILMASASLVAMVATLNIDRIINHDLYDYGLQFSTNWAVPYWTMTAIVFSMGWMIILTSVAFELHLAVHWLHRPPEPEAEAPLVDLELVQNETLRDEAKPSHKPEEIEVKATAAEEVKPLEAKPVEAKPEVTPVVKPVEAKPVEVKSIVKPVEAKPVEVKSIVKPVEAVKPPVMEAVKAPVVQEVKATALALKTEDDLSEFRVRLDDISVMINAPVTRKKEDDRQTS